MYKKKKKINYDKLIEKVNNNSTNRPTFIFGDEKKQEEIEEENRKYPYKINKKLAIEIANKDYTLKNDFLKNTNQNEISYVTFYDYITDIVERNKKKYWQIQVNKGKYTWVEINKKRVKHNERELNEDDFKILRCLIDVQNGDYIYYPNTEDYEERTVKYATSSEKDLFEIFRIKRDNDYDIEKDIIFPTIENKDINL